MPELLLSIATKAAVMLLEALIVRAIQAWLTQAPTPAAA